MHKDYVDFCYVLINFTLMAKVLKKFKYILKQNKRLQTGIIFTNIVGACEIDNLIHYPNMHSIISCLCRKYWVTYASYNRFDILALGWYYRERR